MKYDIFTDATSLELKVGILLKNFSYNTLAIHNNYVIPLIKAGLGLKNLVAFPVPYETPKKCSAKFAKEFLADFLPAIAKQHIHTLLVADPIYFKYLTGLTKTAQAYGYVHECSHIGYEHIKIILIIVQNLKEKNGIVIKNG